MLSMTPAYGFARRHGLAEAGEVAALQNTLARISGATGDLKYNPYMSGGTMNMGTVVAAVNCVLDLGANVPILGEVVTKIHSLISLLEKAPGAGYLVQKLLDPGKVDTILDTIPGVVGVIDSAAGNTAQSIVADIKKSKDFVASHASEINAALNLLSLISPSTAAGPAEYVAQATTPAASPYPSKTFSVYEPGTDTWRIFVPVPRALPAVVVAAAKAGTITPTTMSTAARVASALRGSGFGLGQDPPKENVTELPASPVQPPVSVLSIEEAESRYNIKIKRKAWYKAWQTWAIVGGVLVVGGGTTALVLRRRRRLVSA